MVQLFRESRDLTAEPFNPLSISPNLKLLLVNALNSPAAQKLELPSIRVLYRCRGSLLLLLRSPQRPTVYKRYTSGRPCNRLWEIIIIVPRNERDEEDSSESPCRSLRYIFHSLKSEKDVRKCLLPGGTHYIACVFFLSLLICMRFDPIRRIVVSLQSLPRCTARTSFLLFSHFVKALSVI